MNKKLATILTAVVALVLSFTMVMGMAVYADDANDTIITSDVAEAADIASADANTENQEKAEEKPSTTLAPSDETTTTTQPKWKSIVLMVVVYGGLFAVLYFLIIRPQKKKRKEEEQMRSSLMVGDTITTIGGIVGRVVQIQDDELTIETSLDRSLLTFKNWAVRDIKHLDSDNK